MVTKKSNMSLRWAVFSWQPHNKHKDLHVNSSGFPGTSSKEVFTKVINRLFNTLTFSLTEHKRGGSSRETQKGKGRDRQKGTQGKEEWLRERDTDIEGSREGKRETARD